MKLTRIVALATAASLGLTLASCSDAPSGGSALKTSGPEAIADGDNSGLAVSQRLFDSADTIVVAAADPAAQRAAAEQAIADGAPMLVATGSNGAQIVEEATRLGAKTIKTAGSVAGLEGTDATIEQIEVPAYTPATHQPVLDPGPIDAHTAIDLETSPNPEDNESASPEAQLTTDIAALESDAKDSMPPFFATAGTAAASVATAKAAGADVQLLSYPDPRVTSESMKLAAEGDTIALGDEFGDTARYAAAVDMADNGELPGGGGLVFPGRRMIAYYGHPSGDALGVMGSLPPAEAAQAVSDLAAEYQQYETQPVIPAFEVIVTVASEFPGEDGDYSNSVPTDFAMEDYVAYIDAITEAGGYAVIDLQPGRASLLQQAQLHEELLKRPNVGLALDPEWKLGPDELPMTNIGHVEAAEVNEVADWLAQFTRENNLPQKALVLHQFQWQMIRDREQVNTDHPELAFVLHADGHGSPDLKFETWNVLQDGLEGEWFMAWKNFIDEDTPTFTPEETFNWVDPRPWFVSYQ
ncbi:hypothetical protein [Corynebacterium uterequi]|uniref:Cell wall-binding repeat 2 family protein n=1 Tax=Corynebacterium uterequi TaxID=1072256 RepID=A0A0G3HG77_9CORY|nr:hypothetical protein [Corynebacterium uterequi]AKK10958.1 hypothetical protein CUTER_04765 [Corynebacterium uterequi]